MHRPRCSLPARGRYVSAGAHLIRHACMSVVLRSTDYLVKIDARIYDDKPAEKNCSKNGEGKQRKETSMSLKQNFEDK